MYRSLAEVEHEAREAAIQEQDLYRCRICNTYLIAHYWECDWDDGDSEPDFRPEKVYQLYFLYCDLICCLFICLFAWLLACLFACLLVSGENE